MGANASTEDGGKSVVLRDVDAESIASTSGMTKSEVSQLFLLLMLFLFFLLLILPYDSPPRLLFQVHNAYESFSKGHANGLMNRKDFR